jgi:acyl-CoA thioesterase-1
VSGGLGVAAEDKMRSQRLLRLFLLLGTLTVALDAHVNAAEDLSGVKGKIFHVEPDEKSFELLKETVFDPRTNEGKSRHTVYWTEETEFVRVVRHKSFKDIQGRVLVEFYALNQKWADAIEAGKPFRDRCVNILPSTDKPHGLSKDRRSLVGWFEPDPNSARHRDGVVEFNGKSVKASLPGPNGAVDVYSAASAEEISNGFWETTVWGERVDGKFVVSRMEVYPQIDPRAVDDPNLPRVLVVGDSISMNYHESARDALKGIANYYRVEGNAGPSDRGVVCMELWLGDYRQEGLHWDLIQFNHGLHDLKQFYDEETETYGKHQIDIDKYKANLEKEIAILRKTGALLMWCSTTPVPNSSVGRWDNVTMGRRKDEDLIFNRAALEVLEKHPDILINDLNGTIRKAVENTDLFDDWRKGNDVHFWHRPQQEVVGKAVAVAVKRALESRTLPQSRSGRRLMDIPECGTRTGERLSSVIRQLD